MKKTMNRLSYQENHMSRIAGLKKIVAMAVLIGFSTFTLTGCASDQYQRNKGAAIGGGGGAVAGGTLGGMIGARSGQTATGVVIGGLLGALAGAAIGHYAYDQQRTEEAAQEEYGYSYDQSKANLVRIEKAVARPGAARRGDTIELLTTYTVLGPKGANMEVTEIREIRNEKRELTGRPRITVRRQGGTYTSRLPLTLPANAQRGTYIVYATVESGGSSDTKEFTFTVR